MIMESENRAEQEKRRLPKLNIIVEKSTPTPIEEKDTLPGSQISLNSLKEIKEPMSALTATIKRVTEKYSSTIQASFTLFKSFVGSGILALPYAFQTAGLALSTIMTIMIGFMLCHCFLLLLRTADDAVGRKKISFPKLAGHIIGERGKILVQILLIIEQLGCCIGIIIFTKDFLNHILCSFDVGSLCNNTAFNLLFSLSLVVPLSLINNMHYFYIPSLAANFFIVIALISQIVFDFQAFDQNSKNSLKQNAGFHITSLPLFYGVALYSFEGVGVTFSIRDSMQKPEELPNLVKKQMISLTTVYIIFSGISAIALGDRLEDIVFFSLPTDRPFYLLIQILYAVSALLTYPIQLFPALRIIENSNMLRMRIFNEKGQTKNRKLRYGLRLAVIGLVFVIAYTAKSFHLFLNCLGSFVFTSLGFALPIYLYMTHFKERVTREEKLLNYSIIVISFICGSIGFVVSLIEMFKS